MTNTFTATVNVMVVNAGLKAAGEIEAFLIAQGKAVTVPMLKESMDELFTAYGSKTKKAVLINHLSRSLDMQIGMMEDDDFAAEMDAMTGPKAEKVEVQGTVGSISESAAVETAVAETKPKEETSMNEKFQLLTDNKGRSLVYNNRNNESAIEKMSTSTKIDTRSKAKDIPGSLKDMLAKVEDTKDKYLRNIGEHAVTVVGLTFYPTKKEATRKQVRDRKVIRTDDYDRTFIGEVVVKLPRDYAQIKVWDKNAPNRKGKLGAFVQVDFADYDMDATRMRDPFQPPAFGSGLLKLLIRQNKEGQPFVRLPIDADRNKRGVYYDVFRTSDIRFMKTKDALDPDMPLFLSDNNDAFNAQVSAWLQVFDANFKEANILNNDSFDKSTCVHQIRLQTRDGVMDDEHMDSKKSRVVMEQADVMQLAQVGVAQPTTVCGVTGEFIDIEGVLALNEATTMEATHYVDDEGNIRYQRHDEVMIAGKAVKKSDVIKNAVEEHCAACPFNCMNVPKQEAQIKMEKTKLREKTGEANPYVNAYYRGFALPSAQAVQTLVEKEGKETWVTKYPGEVEAPLGFRVKGAGMTVYGSDEVMDYADAEFVAETEEPNERHIEVMKHINQLFYAAFNLDKLTKEQSDIIFEMADNKPSDLTKYEERKWNKAVQMLANSMQWAIDKEKANNIPDFHQKFFSGVKAGTTELHISEVMGERMERLERSDFETMESLMESGKYEDEERTSKKNNINRNDYIHAVYDDLTAAEMVRYLDDLAIDIVYEVIEEGTSFSIVGDSEGDTTLAAQAMQEMLQNELTKNYYRFADGKSINNSIVSSVRRAPNQGEALKKLKACSEVKQYIASVVGLAE